jgi:hypothetical protein
MAQTVSRSGVPFLMAKDIAKTVSNKIRKEPSMKRGSRITKKNNDEIIGTSIVSPTETKQEGLKRTEQKTVSAIQIRALVAAELRERNRSDIAASYSGQSPENTLGDKFQNLSENERISVTGATQHTRQPANRNRVIHDMSKIGGGNIYINKLRC